MKFSRPIVPILGICCAKFRIKKAVFIWTYVLIGKSELIEIIESLHFD